MGRWAGALGLQASFPAPQTSLLGTPQGQLLLSLSAPPRWRPGSNWLASERGGERGGVFVCVCECVSVSARACVRTCTQIRAVIVILFSVMRFIQFPQICFYSHLSHCFIPSHFVFGKTWELFLWGQGSWSFLFQPLQTVQSFQQALPLLSSFLSLELLLGEE